jgi:hypothetical protein
MRCFLIVAVVIQGCLLAFSGNASAQIAPAVATSPATPNFSRPYKEIAACEKGTFTCREYCAKCNPVSACEVACVQMNNRCVGKVCRERHKQ